MSQTRQITMLWLFYQQLLSRVILSPHTDAFWRLCSRRNKKTRWQKEKWFIMSNVAFCKNVFIFIQLYYIHLKRFYISLPKWVSFLGLVDSKDMFKMFNAPVKPIHMSGLRLSVVLIQLKRFMNSSVKEKCKNVLTTV